MSEEISYRVRQQQYTGFYQVDRTTNGKAWKTLVITRTLAQAEEYFNGLRSAELRKA